MVTQTQDTEPSWVPDANDRATWHNEAHRAGAAAERRDSWDRLATFIKVGAISLATVAVLAIVLLGADVILAIEAAH